MIVERTIYLPCSAEACFREVKTSRLLVFVSWPLLSFKPIDPPALPTEWQEKHYLVRPYLFGIIPLGRQHINITGQDRSTEKGGFHVDLRDNGYGAFISKWDHLITIRHATGGCFYTDRVEIEAALLTRFVVAFAWFFYRHRQRRWQRLVASGFAYTNELRRQ